jgi:hypothetical protein
VIRGLLEKAKLLLQFERQTHGGLSQDSLWEAETSGSYQGQYFRRQFVNKYFDIYLWFESDRRSLFGFQICYSKGIDEHAFTWTKAKGYQHNRIDDGDRPSSSLGYKMAAVLEPNGIFDAKAIAQRFLQNLGIVDRKIAYLIYTKLMEYSP